MTESLEDRILAAVDAEAGLDFCNLAERFDLPLREVAEAVQAMLLSGKLAIDDGAEAH